MYCGQFSVVKSNSQSIEASTLKCKCWDCDNCEPGRREALRQLALAGEPNKFLTLTVNPAHGVDADDRARALLWAWRVLVKRMKRKMKVTSLPYLWVMEATKNGEPHLHILMRCGYVDQEFISACMDELINAPIVWIRAIKDQGKMAAYVAKYCSKDARRFAGCKRYGYTKGWAINEAYLAEKAEFVSEGWKKCSFNLQTLEREILLAGGVVEWLSDNSFTADRFDNHPDERWRMQRVTGWLSSATASMPTARRTTTIEPGEYDDCLPPDVTRRQYFRQGPRDRELEPWSYKPRYTPPAKWTRAKRRGSIEDELHVESVVVETIQ